jgi:hypothetical protein
MYLVDDAAVTYSGDEYITVRLVNKELQTTDLSGGDILSYYWNVDHEGFDDGLPEVSWIFQYDDSDINGGTEANYVPGKVLDYGTYTRSNDGDCDRRKRCRAAGNNGDILGTNPNNIIVFNGITGANDDIDSGTGDAIFYQGIIDSQWSTQFPEPDLHWKMLIILQEKLPDLLEALNYITVQIEQQYIAEEIGMILPHGLRLVTIQQ